MESYLNKRVRGSLKAVDFGKVEASSAFSALGEIDQYWDTCEGSIYGDAISVVTLSNVNIVKIKNARSLDNIWMDVLKTFKISPDYSLVNSMIRRSDKLNYKGIFDPFLDTFKINEKLPCHDFLLGRARTETLTYGSLPLYKWLIFFLSLCESNNIPLELKYISGIVHYISKNSNGSPPVVVTRKDFSFLKYVSGFYNVNNIIESLLNLCNIRFGLNHTILRFGSSTVDLLSVCDELALRVCVSPKIVIKEIRNFLTLCVRRAGIFSSNPSYLMHRNSDPERGNPSAEFQIVAAPHALVSKFITPSFLSAYEEGKKLLKDLKFLKLLHLCENILNCTLLKGKDGYISVDHFAASCSFLMSIMSVAGYGRGFKYAATPRSQPDDPVKYSSMGSEVKEIINEIHESACARGFTPVTDEDWVSSCMAYWKSTSSGMRPVPLNVNIDGKVTSVKVSRKLAVGTSLGMDLFKRSSLSKKMDQDNPGKTGVRDVPYKLTRLIYVVPLPTLHAMVAVASHMVRYVSSGDANSPRVGRPFTCDHIASGVDDTTGVRLADNISTLLASGTEFYLSYDCDFSNFDSSCVATNFRKPLIEGLKSLGISNSYGPDKIPYSEMVDYAFGDGYIHNTYWDVGRQPLWVLRTDVPSDVQSEMITKYSLDTISTSKVNPSISSLHGSKSMNPDSSYHVTDADVAPKDMENFFIGNRSDGRDLVLLTSEASGELTTLMMNSIANLAAQNIFLKRIKETKFGNCVRPVSQKAIGDDVTILLKIDSHDFTSQDVEDFIVFTSKVFDGCGFSLSIPKTHLLIFSAEFVQTYCNLGIYQPKDQIMVIPSEKPRVIDNPSEFLQSLKRLYLSKISRGFSHNFAFLSLMYQARHIQKFDMRRYKMELMQAKEMKADIRSPSIFSKPMHISKVHDSLASVKKSGSYEFSEVFLSPHWLFLPPSAGGIGLNALCLNLVNTPAFFLFNVSQMEGNERTRWSGFFQYAKSRYHLKSASSSVAAHVDKSDLKLLTFNNIFNPSVVHRILEIRKFGFKNKSINAEDIPTRMLNDGLQYENFIKEYSFSRREEEHLKFLKSLSSGIPTYRCDGDEFLLSYTYEYTEVSPLCVAEFIGGLSPRIKLLQQSFDAQIVKSRKFRRFDRLRMIISRDPILKSRLSPEQVCQALEDERVLGESDRAKGLVVLSSMGFDISVAEAILDYRFGPEALPPGNEFGALSDDVSNLFEMIPPEDVKSFFTPKGVDFSIRHSMFVFSVQVSLFYLFNCGRSGSHYKPVAANLPSDQEQRQYGRVKVNVISDLLNLKNTLRLPSVASYVTRVGTKEVNFVKLSNIIVEQIAR
uniref:RNA-dependent RNA polymerase n=1 Tax=Hubei reo-like virus 14 TaxID=1923176 RepID=A0A6G7PSA0_9VIRU|nr:RNA-dependent RNA polymerase [Hubei reo-like virus 14]